MEQVSSWRLHGESETNVINVKVACDHSECQTKLFKEHLQKIMLCCTETEQINSKKGKLFIKLINKNRLVGQAPEYHLKHKMIQDENLCRKPGTFCLDF